MTAFAKWISWWGMTSLLLVIGNFVIGRYSFHLQDTGRQPLFSTIANYELCVVMQMAGAVCGIIAIRRGSWWWGFLVFAAILMALGCYFSEV